MGEVNIWAALTEPPRVDDGIRGLRCPNCLSSSLRVQQTIAGVKSTVRRRVCNSCEYRFVTEERFASSAVYNEASRAHKHRK